MKIILDHCVNIEAKGLIKADVVMHASEIGWSHLSNGELIAAARSQGFDVLVTVDKNMMFQSSLKGLNVAVAVLNVRSNLLKELVRAVEALQGLLPDLEPETFTVVNAQ